MALNLHEKCLSSLKERLAVCLPQLNLKGGKFIDIASLRCLEDLNKTLPTSKEIVSIFEKIINDQPFSDFVFGELSKELYEAQETDLETKCKKLINLPEYVDVEKLAARLVESFDSLPRHYCLSFKLSRSVPKFFPGAEFRLSDSIRIICPDERFRAEFPVETGNPERDRLLHGLSLLSIGTTSEWDFQSAYLQIESSGFIGKWVSTTPVEFSVGQFKAIIGIAVALRALGVGHVTSHWQYKQKVVIHERKDDRWELFDSFELDEELSKIIDGLYLYLEFFFKEERVRDEFLMSRFLLLKRVFSNPKISERVLLAGRWLLDSHGGKNELLSFVQATVALEILLGDKESSDVVGLSELLSNRCAYLIGKTHDERSDVLNKFKKIYDIRCKIVHRGKDRLNRKERLLFNDLQRLVCRVIQEEIERLEKV